jgi:hypothetical protein
MQRLSRLENLMQEHVSVQMSNGNGLARGTVLMSMRLDLPPDVIPIPNAIRIAINRSRFTVELEDGRIM